jgi:hypothetical protein
MKNVFILNVLIILFLVNILDAAWRPGEMQVAITVNNRSDINLIFKEKLTIDQIIGNQMFLLAYRISSGDYHTQHGRAFPNAPQQSGFCCLSRL